MTSSFKIGLLLTPALLLTGCGMFGSTPSAKPSPAPTPTNIETEFRTNDDLKPDVAPPAEAHIILSGTEIPVTLTEKRESNSIVYSWMVDAEGETGTPVEVEREKYFSSKDLFSFAATAHEKYDPPLNLIRYPLTVGDSWDWSGDVVIGKNRTKANAKITSSADTLNLPAGNTSALLITVDLTYAGNAAPSVRQLKFWFKPGMGLIRRELWGSSTREPSRPLPPPDSEAPVAE